MVPCHQDAFYSTKTLYLIYLTNLLSIDPSYLMARVAAAVFVVIAAPCTATGRLLGLLRERFQTAQQPRCRALGQRRNGRRSRV